MILGFTDYETPGRHLASALGREFALVDVHRFPDGESKVTLPAELPADVILCRSLDHPNEKLVELMLAAGAARDLGAERLTLAAPYLCYMRQDAAFHPGEAISQRILGRFMAGWFDALVTVDPHLHRTPDLASAVPVSRPIALSCAPAMAAFLRERFGSGKDAPLLLGPDGESRQWVAAIADAAGLEFAVAEKERLGDHEVRTTLPALDYAGRTIVMIDDMASTGRTLVSIAAQLKAAGAGPLHCLVTHALFAEGSTRILAESGVDGIWSSDSITHPSNRVSLTPLLAEAIRGLDSDQ